MKVFLSWSGDKSKAIAKLLKVWLPSVLQAIENPWMSDVDIESGANWSASIGIQLNSADYGIICVTRENQARPWLNFEAGAISKLVDGAVPLLIDFPSPTDLAGGPMSQLQVRMLNEEGMLLMLTDMNARLSRPLEPAVLQLAFERGYPEFVTGYQEILADPQYTSITAPRDRESKVDEVLEIVRGLARSVPQTQEMLLDFLVDMPVRGSRTRNRRAALRIPHDDDQANPAVIADAERWADRFTATATEMISRHIPLEERTRISFNFLPEKNIMVSSHPLAEEVAIKIINDSHMMLGTRPSIIYQPSGQTV